MAKASPVLRRGAPARFAAPVGVGSPQAPAPVSTDQAPDSHPRGPILTFAPSPQAARAYHLDHTTVEDIDALWDWVRADRSGTSAFLGQPHANSQSFFSQIVALYEREQRGTAWFRAVRNVKGLVGFVLLTLAPQAATMQMYVEPSERGAFADVLRDVLAGVDTQAPRLALVTASDDPDVIAAFRGHGFTPTTVLTRPVTQAVPHDGV